MLSLEKKLEAVLFYKAEPATLRLLAKLLHVTEEEVDEAGHALSATLAERGVKLLRVNDALELVTAPEVSDLIQELRKEELSRDLGKAGMETLAVILYRGPLTRAQLDYVRGVNSTFMLRNLQVRGLIERIPNPSDARSFVYQATPDLLKHLGITSIKTLPEYEAIRTEIHSFEDSVLELQNAQSLQEEPKESVPLPHVEPSADEAKIL